MRVPLLRKASTPSAFTLLELMAAIGVLSMGVLGSVSVYFAARQTAGAFERQQRAVMAAQAEIEQLRSSGWSNWEGYLGRHELPEDGSGLGEAAAIISATDWPGAEGELKQVRVVVEWKSRGKRREVCLETLVAARRE